MKPSQIKLAEALFPYHGGSNDAVYAVASTLYAGYDITDFALIERAQIELNHHLMYLRLKSRTLTEQHYVSRLIYRLGKLIKFPHLKSPNTVKNIPQHNFICSIKNNRISVLTYCTKIRGKVDDYYLIYFNNVLLGYTDDVNIMHIYSDNEEYYVFNR